MLKLFILLILSISHVSGQTFIEQNPTKSYTFPNQDAPYEIKMFPSGKKLLLTSLNGLIKCMDLQTQTFQIWDAHRNRVVDIQWIPQHGPITLDKNGMAVRWSMSGVPQYKWQMDQKASDMSLTKDRQGTYFVAFCLQTQVRQFKALQNSNQTTMVMDEQYAHYRLIQYDMSHNFIYSYTWYSKNTSRILLQKYGCFDGKLLAQKQLVNSPAEFRPYSNDYILMDLIDIEVFDYNLTFTTKYSALNYFQNLELCPNGLIIILFNLQTILVLNDTKIQQNISLTSEMNKIAKIDCNKDYILIYGSVNNSISQKVVKIFKFYNTGPTPTPTPDPSPNPGDDSYQTQIIIVGGIIGLVVSLVLAVLIIRKCRKKGSIQSKNQKKSLLINKSQLQ